MSDETKLSQEKSNDDDSSLLMEDESGISEEDRQELLKSIEGIASENRIVFDDTVNSALKEAKSGVLFPIMVNFLSILVVGVVVLVLSRTFQNDTENLVRSAIEFSSLESQLIREIQRESQGAISSKDSEINDYQNRIADLDNQLRNLDSSIQERTDARQAEFEIELQNTLETERERLVAQGISSEEVDRLLNVQEEELRSYYLGLLSDYELELENERTDIAGNISQLRTEYQQQITDLEQERDELIDDFRTQEENLRSELQSQSELLENTSEEALANLQNAQNELANLEAQQERVSIAESQLIGLYTRLEDSLNSTDFQSALQVIEQARAFLNERSILELEALSERRNADLFVLNTIEQYINNNIQTVESVSTISSQIEILTRIRSNNERASVAISNDDAILALQLYSDTMSLMPELSIANDALVEDGRNQAIEQTTEQITGQFDSELEERTAIINSLVTTANNAVQSGDYNTALNAYDQALQAVQEFGEVNQSFNNGLISVGYSLADQVVNQQTPSNEIIQRANINISATIDSINDQILNSVTEAVAAREAELEEIRLRDLSLSNEEFNRLLEQSQEDISSLSSELNTTFNAQLNNLRTENEQLTADITQRDGQIADLEGQISRLDGDLGGVNQSLIDSQALNVELQQLADQRQEEINSLVDFRTQLETLQNKYSDYQSLVNSIRQDSSNENIGFDLQRELESFVGSPELDSIFPNLRTEIRANYPYLIEGGRENGLNETKDVVVEFVSQATREQGILYLETELQFAQEDGDMTLEEYLSDLLSEIQ